MGKRVSFVFPSETRTSHVREPREMSCPAFQAIRTPPARKRAHRPHTSAAKVKIYWGIGEGATDRESQWPGCAHFLPNGGGIAADGLQGTNDDWSANPHAGDIGGTLTYGFVAQPALTEHNDPPSSASIFASKDDSENKSSRNDVESQCYASLMNLPFDPKRFRAYEIEFGAGGQRLGCSSFWTTDHCCLFPSLRSHLRSIR